MPPIPAQLRRVSLTKQTLMLMLMVCVGWSGLALTYASECESAPAKSELVELETMVAEKKCRRRRCPQASRRSGDKVLATRVTQAFGLSGLLATIASSEHSLRNGGIGTSLRC